MSTPSRIFGRETTWVSCCPYIFRERSVRVEPLSIPSPATIAWRLSEGKAFSFILQPRQRVPYVAPGIKGTQPDQA